MTYTSTTELLAAAIEASPLTHREIAERVGFQAANMVSMIKVGVTRAPLNRIPALEQTLEIEKGVLLQLALKEYHPEVHEMLFSTYSLPVTTEESELISLLRAVDPVDRPKKTAAIKAVLAQ